MVTLDKKQARFILDFMLENGTDPNSEMARTILAKLREVTDAREDRPSCDCWFCRGDYNTLNTRYD